ncbi:hypothetical protein Tsp_02292 [Trichinella spiralis]|uniref:hypothetical protein n=1 Tax=Trichinella spiralis TaxID=6334 RepID=UPI0001EFCCA8|nr:hypothetical protein Tsp_02292 [Trichinella spiralis]
MGFTQRISPFFDVELELTSCLANDFQTVNIPVVKASTMREEVAIETQNTITKILLEWDKQHASGAQTVGIITAYDITLVKKFCKVQAKYADVNDSSKVVSSPVKSPVQSTIYYD